MKLFGGYGYTTDFPVGEFMRDAKITQFMKVPIRFSELSWHAPCCSDAERLHAHRDAATSVAGTLTHITKAL